MGLKDPELENHNAIEAKIKSMEKEFDLVMINEFMDESLVLLAHLLCLPLSTMVGLKLNQRKSKVKVSGFARVLGLVALTSIIIC